MSEFIRTPAAMVMAGVRQASTEILIATRRFEFDAFGQRLLSELEYACQRGLRVRCLLDARESASVISAHPALFTQLETRFRVHDSAVEPATRLVFDRRRALAGDFPLNAELHARDYRCEVLTDREAATLAQTFDACWEHARGVEPPVISADGARPGR